METLAYGEPISYCEIVDNKQAKPVQLLPGAEITTTDCRTCTCSNLGLQCCEKPKPSADIPAFCKVIHNGCEFQIVLTSDPTVDCYTGQSVITIKKETSPIKALLLSSESKALISLLKKVATLVSSWWYGNEPNQGNHISAPDREYEPTFMDMLRYNSQANPFSQFVNANPFNQFVPNELSLTLNGGISGPSKQPVPNESPLILNGGISGPSNQPVPNGSPLTLNGGISGPTMFPAGTGSLSDNLLMDILTPSTVKDNRKTKTLMKDGSGSGIKDPLTMKGGSGSGIKDPLMIKDGSGSGIADFLTMKSKIKDPLMMKGGSGSGIMDPLMTNMLN